MNLGWGKLNDGKNNLYFNVKISVLFKYLETSGLSDELHYVYLIPISNEECQLSFGSQITDTMVCAGGNFNEGFCKVGWYIICQWLILQYAFQGDSGTPLVRYSNGPRTTHVGIASFISKNGCDTPEPSGYTRTYPYVEWIRNITNIEKIY